MMFPSHFIVPGKLKSWLFLACVFFTTGTMAQLSGTYTVGGTSPYFPTLDSAFNYMERNGVSGKVRLNVRSGQHTLRTTISTISGSSNSRNITVAPDPSNTSPVVFKNKNTSASNNFLVNIKQGFLRFDSLTFVIDSSSTFGTIVEFTGSCNTIDFNSCKFYGKDTNNASINFAIIKENMNIKVDSIRVQNCTMLDGSTGIYLTSPAYQVKSEFRNNVFMKYYYQGIYVSSQNFVVVENNYMRDKGNYQGPWGIFVGWAVSPVISGNQIYVNGKSGYGLYVHGCTGSSSKPTKIHNNFVCGYDTTGNGIFNGLYISSSTYVNIYFNTVAIYSKYITSAAAFLSQNTSSDAFRVKNNIFWARGGYAVNYNGSSAGIIESNHNIFYTTGTNIAYHTSNVKTLEDLKKITGTDTHSFRKNVPFKSINDLHVLDIDLYAKAAAVSGITTDIDGQNRKARPDIGADEMNIPALDLTLMNIKNNFCIGNTDVSVKIKNTGENKIDSGRLRWQISVNGGAFVSQAPVNFTSSLLTGRDTMIRLGTYNFTFASTYIVKAWIEKVNGRTDSLRINDTTVSSPIKIPMSGTYTIGGSSPDFTNVDNAFDLLEKSGVCGPVKLLLRPGTYNEQTVISTIPGTSSVNTVRLVADPSQTGTPRIVYRNGTSNNWVIKFQGTSYISVDSITMISTGSAQGRVIVFNGANSHLSFHRDSMIGVSTTGSSTDLAVIADEAVSSLVHDDLVIENCFIKNGSQAINLNGNDPGSTIPGVIITGNRIVDFSHVGIYSGYHKGSRLQNNYIQDNNAGNDPAGIHLVREHLCKISGNTIKIGGKVSPRGIFSNLTNGVDTSRVLISNNIVSMYSKTATGSVYGIYASEGVFNRIVYNTVVVKGGDTSSKALFAAFHTSGNAEIYNNSFVNYSKGYAGYFQIRANKVKSDNNNFWTRGDYLGFYFAKCSKLSNLKNVSGNESASMEIDPCLSSADLRTKVLLFDSKASALSDVKTDIDGNARHVSAPDIGALEFVPLVNDIAVQEILTYEIPYPCGADSVQVYAIVRNNGTAQQSSIKLKTSVTGTNSQQYTLHDTFKQALLPGALDTFAISKFRTTEGGFFSIQTNPENRDSFRYNDSALAASNFISSSPARPNEKSDTICDNQAYPLSTNIPAGSFLRWYSRYKGGNLIQETDTLTVANLKKDSTMFVAAVYAYPSAKSLKQETGGGSSCKLGQMFDLQPGIDMDLDSFAGTFVSTGKQNVLVYMKKGSYLGHETNPAKWTFVDTISVSPYTGKRFHAIPLSKPVKLLKDSVYGFYLYYGGGYYYTGTYDTFKNSELKMINGSGTCSKFGSVTSGRVFEGHIHYTTYQYCESSRSKYSLKVNKSPVFNIGKDTAYCSKNGMRLLLDPGAGYVSYKWSTGDSTQTIYATDGGKYAVTVSNPYCKATDEMVITKNMSPVINFGPDVHYCASAGINLLLDPGPNFKSYQWSTGSKAKNIRATTAGTYSVAIIDNKDCPGADTIQVVKVNNPKPNLGKDTSYCSREGLNLLLDAGAGYKTYLWPDSDTAQTKPVTTQGKYMVQVGDQYGCTGRDTINVTEKTSPVLHLPNDTFYCRGKSIFLYLAAGSGHKDYLWSTSEKTEDIFASTKGVYTVKVTALNNCPGYDTIVISEISPVVYLGKDTGYCKGSSFNLDLDAGAGFTAYKWSNASSSQIIKVLNKGPYSVEVTDSYGCKNSDTVIISEENPQVRLGNDTAYCSGNGISMMLDAGTGFVKYNWSNGQKVQNIQVTKGGIYKVTVFGRYGCNAADSIFIKENLSPVVKLGGDRVLNPDLPVNETLDAGAGFASYLWSNFDTSRTIAVTAPGIYSVRVSDANGCEGSDTILLRYWNKTGHTPLQYPGVDVYPNPAGSSVKLVSVMMPERVEVYTLSGQKIYALETAGTNIEIDVSEWAEGLYILRYYRGGVSGQRMLVVSR